ncbi:MAG: hypothetical protein ACM3SP_11280 [Chloroflexota bacterium]
MTHPFLVIVGILTMALFLVALPVGFATFYRYRKGRIITCPETRGLAEVQLDARRAALTTVFGKPLLAVKNCSLWPKKKGCDEACVKDNWPRP